jgi:hypothetical protein
MTMKLRMMMTKAARKCCLERGVTLPGEPPMSLWLRTPRQIVLLGLI